MTAYVEPDSYLGGASFSPYRKYFIFAAGVGWRERLTLNRDCPSARKIMMAKAVDRGVYYAIAESPF